MIIDLLKTNSKMMIHDKKRLIHDVVCAYPPQNKNAEEEEKKPWNENILDKPTKNL